MAAGPAAGSHGRPVPALIPLAGLMLPLFVLAALGFILARRSTTDATGACWQQGLAGLTGRLFIPALLFSGTFRSGLPPAVSWQFLAAYFVPLLACFLLVRRLSGDPAHALAATYSNTVFVGIPVLSQAFGAGSLHLAFPIIAFNGLVLFTLYYLTLPHSGPGRLRASIAATARNPIVLSLLLGLGANLSEIVLPQPVLRLLDMLAGAALPCALLALGASLAGLRIGRWRQPAVIAAVKLLVMPLCVLLLARLLGLPETAVAVLAVLAACPAAVNGAVVVQADGRDAGPVSSAILLSSLLCLAVLPAWLTLVV